jgi:aromatic-L-amino-acid/L-tryptophan decarboxylase
LTENGNGALRTGAAEREAAARDVAETVSRYWATYDERPAAVTLSAADRAGLRGPLPRAGIGVRAALADAHERVVLGSTSRSHPRVFPFVDGSALEVAVLGEALVGMLDANLGGGTGAISIIEELGWRWLAELIGFPAADGHFTSGGTHATLAGLAAARVRALPDVRERGVRVDCSVYCSVEAHHVVERSCDMLGLGVGAVRKIGVDERLRLRPELLAAALERDLAAGVLPVAVVATAGTTNTGAIDPIDAIADHCAQHGVWLHVDGAYGAPAAAAPSVSASFAGLARADSVAIDPHKWLYLPKACGCLLMRRDDDLPAAFGGNAPYLESDAEGPMAGPWPIFRGPETSHPARGFKVWLAFMAHGADAFVAAIERDLAHTRLLAEAVRAADDLELLDEPQLSVVVFRHVPDGLSGDALDDHNRALLDAIQRDGRVFLSGTTVRGAFALRPCIISHRSTEADVLAMVDVARELGRGGTG